MKIHLLLYCSFFILQSHAQSWFQLGDFPGTERDDGTSFVIGDTAYCGTGIVPWFLPQRDFHAFNFDTESWSSVAALPQGKERQYASGFASDSFGYVFGGINADFLNDLWRFDPRKNEWQEMSPLPDSIRGGAASFVIDGKAYIIGGKNYDVEAFREVWTYDMVLDQWEQKNDLPFGARWRAGAAASDEKGYLLFGLDDTIGYNSDLYEYNPLTDSWLKIAEFPETKRNYTNLHCIQNQLIFIGGMDSLGMYYNETWSFDLQSKLWTKLDSLPSQGRRAGITFHNENSIFYTTGLTLNGRLKETWKYANLTSLIENKVKLQFKVYPNPAQEKITLDFPQLSSINRLNYSLYDSKGKLIRKAALKHIITSIDISSLSAGLYFVVLNNEEERVVKKVVKW